MQYMIFKTKRTAFCIWLCSAKVSRYNFNVTEWEDRRGGALVWRQYRGATLDKWARQICMELKSLQKYNKNRQCQQLFLSETCQSLTWAGGDRHNDN